MLSGYVLSRLGFVAGQHGILVTSWSSDHQDQKGEKGANSHRDGAAWGHDASDGGGLCILRFPMNSSYLLLEP